MMGRDEKRTTDASPDGIQEGRFSEREASSAIRSENPVVPPPPNPPRLVRDYRELAQDAARIRAQQAERARRARRTRLIALAIAISGVVLILVGAAAVLLVAHPGDVANSSDDAPALQAPAEQEGDGSESGDDAGSSPSGGQADESVSAVEQVVATDQISAAFSSLAANEDGVFDGFVQSFMDDYDRGVNGEVSYDLADLGIRAEDLSQALLSGFSCSVSNVDVHGSTAWVTLEVTSKSLADQADAFARSVEGADASFEDEEAYKAFLTQAYFDAFDGVSPRSHSLLITVEKSGSGWPVADDTIEYVLGSVWYTSA